MNEFIVRKTSLKVTFLVSVQRFLKKEVIGKKTIMNSYRLTAMACIICLPAMVVGQQPLVSSVMDFLVRSRRNMFLENMDESKSFAKNEFDFIVVGAGTAGCALASRLTENPNWSVLLLEAGDNENLLMDVPLLVNFLQLNPAVNWGYRPQSSNTSCLAMKNNRCNWPRGKVMGKFVSRSSISIGFQ